MLAAAASRSAGRDMCEASRTAAAKMTGGAPLWSDVKALSCQQPLPYGRPSISFSLSLRGCARGHERVAATLQGCLLNR